MDEMKKKKYQITDFLQMKFVHFLLKYALPLVAYVLNKKISVYW